MRILITGDRQAFPPAVMPIVSIELLKAIGKDPEFAATVGDFPGVEDAAHFLLSAANIEHAHLPETPKLANGKPDLEARAEYLATHGGLDRILFIHGDPMVSSIYKSLVAVPQLADKVELVGIEIAAAPAED